MVVSAILQFLRPGMRSVNVLSFHSFSYISIDLF